MIFYCSRQFQIQVQTHGIHGLFLTCGKINTCYYTNNSVARIYMGKDFKGLLVIWLLHYNVTIFADRMLIN
jgi:hypothetical protein